MTTVSKDLASFAVKSASGTISATFDGISLTNFHTLSCRGENNATFLGISITGGFTPQATFNPTGASANAVNQMLAQIIMYLGKGR